MYILPGKCYLFLILFLFSFRSVAQINYTDTLSEETTTSLRDSFETDDDIINGTSVIPTKMQLRFSSSLNTQRAIYNDSWNRIDNNSRTSNFNLTLQGYYQITIRLNAGLLLSTRSLSIGGFDASPLNAVSVKENNHLKFYLRNSSLLVRYLLHEKKYKVVFQSIFFIPLEKTVELPYKENSVRDLLSPLWTNQFICSRKYSENFTLFSSPFILQMRFGNESVDRQISVRTSITPQFNYYFTPKVNFFAFTELNLLLYNEASSGFFFREGMGIGFLTKRNINFNAAYSYFALGRKTNALNTFILSSRYNF